MYEFTSFKKSDNINIESFMKFPREIMTRKEYKELTPSAMLLYTLLVDRLELSFKQIEKTANERFELLMRQLVEKENITEELKANNQLEWVCKMNNIKHSAEEIILNELIYS